MELNVGTMLVCKRDIKFRRKSWNGNPYLFYKDQVCEVLCRLSPKLDPNSYWISNPQSVDGKTLMTIEDIIKDFDIL